MPRSRTAELGIERSDPLQLLLGRRGELTLQRERVLPCILPQDGSWHRLSLHVVELQLANGLSDACTHVNSTDGAVIAQAPRALRVLAASGAALCEAAVAAANRAGFAIVVPNN